MTLLVEQMQKENELAEILVKRLQNGEIDNYSIQEYLKITSTIITMKVNALLTGE